MSTTIQLKATASAVIDRTATTTHITPDAYQSLISARTILFAFEAPTGYEYRKINSLWFKAKGKLSRVPSYDSLYPEVLTIQGSWDPATVTYQTKPSTYGYKRHLDFYSTTTDLWEQSQVPGEDNDALHYGVGVESLYETVSLYTSYAASSNKPYLEVVFYDENSSLSPIGSPRNVYRDPSQTITLSWSNTRVGKSYSEPTQTSAVVSYRESGSAVETTISVTTAQSVTLPANTWDAATSYQWRVAVTDSGGTTTTTSWYTISTAAAAATPPTLDYPNGEAIDGSDAVIFRWTNNGVDNNTGTDLAFSDDGTSWGAAINFGVGVSSYTVPAGTFTSGTHYWRGRAYNADGTAGDWSDPVPFIIIAAPAAPYFEITNTPRPTISWVSDEQQAFQVQMGDYDTGLVFGTAQSFKCPVFLPDGDTIVRVRVMNQYNLWSEWSGTQITIANASSDAPPVLTVSTGAEALLTWTPGYNTTNIDGTDLTWTLGKSISATGSLSGNVPGFGRSDYIALDGATHVRYTGPATGTSDKPYSPMVAFYNGTTFISRELFGNYDGKIVPVPSSATQMRVVMGYASAQDETATQTDVEKFAAALFMSEAAHYLVYRDGALIGETDGLSYQDRWGIGDVTYMVRAALTGDNYADSNDVEVTLSVGHPMIAAIGGPWVPLRYTTEPVQSTIISTQQSVALMQFSGSEYPVPEIAPHRTRSYQISTAFIRGEGAEFEALLGQECVLKDQYGTMIHGVVASIQKAQNRWYTVYSAELQQIEGDL